MYYQLANLKSQIYTYVTENKNSIIAMIHLRDEIYNQMINKNKCVKM